jgi:hypothetical protein
VSGVEIVAVASSGAVSNQRDAPNQRDARDRH